MSGIILFVPATLNHMTKLPFFRDPMIKSYCLTLSMIRNSTICDLVHDYLKGKYKFNRVWRDLELPRLIWASYDNPKPCDFQLISRGLDHNDLNLDSIAVWANQIVINHRLVMLIVDDENCSYIQGPPCIAIARFAPINDQDIVEAFRDPRAYRFPFGIGLRLRLDYILK